MQTYVPLSSMNVQQTPWSLVSRQYKYKIYKRTPLHVK